MKFSCESTILQKGIQVVEKAISTRTALPVMENIYFELNGPNLKLRGNDLELGIEYSVPVEDVKEEGSILVKAKTISSIVSKMSTQKLNITVNDKQKVIIKADSVDFEILGSSTEEYPAFPKVEDGMQIDLKVSDIMDLIKHTLFAVSFDETKPFLNGVLIKADGPDLYFVSTDGFRLSLKKVNVVGIPQELSVIVPHKSLSELLKIIQQYKETDSVHINLSGNQISFSMPGFTLVSRLIQGQFPDYKQVLPKNSENVFHIPRRFLVSAADRASIIAVHSNNVVRLIFGDEAIRLKAVTPKMGEFKEDVQVKRIKGQGEVKVSFNVKLILDAIRNLETDDLIIEFNSELSPCIIRPTGDDSYTYIIMPIRTSDFEDSTQNT